MVFKQFHIVTYTHNQNSINYLLEMFLSSEMIVPTAVQVTRSIFPEQSVVDVISSPSEVVLYRNFK